MDIVINFLLLVLGFVMLAKGADWFVDGAAGIATRLGIPQLVIGLTIVAMGTSAPEAAVSITAAFGGNADITIGNVLGSNVLNMLVILGLAAVIIPITVAKSTIRMDIPFTIGISVLLLLFGLNGEISRIEGAIFIALIIGYMTYLIICAKKNKLESDDDTKELSVPKALIFTVIGLAVIILGSNFTVDAATRIAEIIGLSERLIGLTIVALGTSLPELFTSVTAARKGNADIAIGNIVGSNIFNILFVVGLSAIIIPVPFTVNFIFDAVVAIIAVVLLFLLSLRGKLMRWAGALLLTGYIAYFVKILLF